MISQDEAGKYYRTVDPIDLMIVQRDLRFGQKWDDIRGMSAFGLYRHMVGEIEARAQERGHFQTPY